MRTLLLLAAALPFAGCAALPTTFHNPTTEGFAGEIGPLVSADKDAPAEDVTSDEKEKTKTKSNGGAVGLLQFGGGYMKMEAAPLPGMWLGYGLTDPKPGKFGWFPAIELTGSSANDNGDKEESKDGFLTDDAGNRYLYEIKRSHSGFGLAVPQLFEVYPVKKFAIFWGVMPAYLNESTKTTVEMVYENDRRIVKADPVLDAKFQDIQEYEQRNDKSISRWTMPISLGVRFQVKSFHMRLAATSHRVDSLKDYDNAFKDVFFLTVGYASTDAVRRSNYNQGPSQYHQQPQPQQQPGSTTTTTTTNGQTTTTTTTTTPQPAQSQPRQPQPVTPQINIRIGK